MQRAASDLDLVLDPPLTTIRQTDLGYSMVASVATFPEDDIARLLMQSALHVALHEEFGETVDIRVVVPRPLKGPVITLPPVPNDAFPTVWMQEYLKLGHERVREYAIVFAHAAYTQAVYALPWRDAGAMAARIPALLEMTALAVDTHRTVSVLMGNVDIILPPMEGLVLPMDRPVVEDEVARAIGRPAATLMELYETVWRLVNTGRTTQQTLRLYVCLFL
jgi:hypothetical protein